MITEIEKLAEIMKRLEVIPKTGHGMTIVFWKEGKPTKIHLQIDYLINDNKLVVNKNGFDLR